MGLFGRLFQPKEVKATLLALDIEGEKLSRNVGTYASSAFELIRNDVRSLIEQNADTVIKKVSNEGITPNQLALTLTLNVAFDRLRSGTLHIHRGTLSGEGTGMRALWDHLITDLGRMGVYTDEDIQDARQRLAADIKEAG